VGIRIEKCCFSGDGCVLLATVISFISGKLIIILPPPVTDVTHNKHWGCGKIKNSAIQSSPCNFSKLFRSFGADGTLSGSQY
jgi:hypothetical protein